MKNLRLTENTISITLPDTVSGFHEVNLQRNQKGMRRSTQSPEISSELSKMLEALTEDETENKKKAENLIHGFSFNLSDEESKKKLRGLNSDEQETLSIDVTLEPDEDAIVLIENDGIYEWYFPEDINTSDNQVTRRVLSDQEPHTAHFTFNIGRSSIYNENNHRKRGIGDTIIEYVKGKVIGFVIKFVARKSVGVLTRNLEKGVKPGAIHIKSSADVNSWIHINNYTDIDLPTHRPLNILLLIHGTFSSTVGSFGALTEHVTGQKFLEQSLQQYDAVIGYDHHTLSETPKQNAEDIYALLDELQKQYHRNIEIDAIAFSRGGLVYRYLTEKIIPEKQNSLLFHKAIFVGCTNAGTELANHENWITLIDFYTNMVAGASRLLELHPGSKVAGMILNQGIKIIGSLVKYMAQSAVEGEVPGLAAMSPSGSFIKSINDSSISHTGSGAQTYFAIGSDFEPNSDTSTGKIFKRLMLRVSDSLIDQLMDKKNDLVVNRDSMFIIDPNTNSILSDKLLMDQNPEIYHTVYFHQPEIVNQCSLWLGFSPSSITKTLDSSVMEPSRKVPKLSVSPDDIEELSEDDLREAIGELLGDDLGDSIVEHLEGDLEESIEESMIPASRSNRSSDNDTIEEMLHPVGRSAVSESRGESLTESPPSPEPDTTWCYVHANMSAEAVIDEISTLEVTLSRDEIIKSGGISASGGGEVQIEKDLIVQVIASKDCIISGESRAIVPVPEQGKDTSLFFDILPKFEGIGEIRIIVRQGNQPIADLRLRPQFVNAVKPDLVDITSAEAYFTPSDNRQEIKNVLFIREAKMGNTHVLDFEFEYEVNATKMRVRGRSEPFSNDSVRKEYITALYKDIEGFWASSNKEFDSFMFKLRIRGAEIFNKLIPQSLQQVLWEYKDQLSAIQVFSDEPFIPWELAYLLDPVSKTISDKSSFLAEKGMVRGYSNPNGITQEVPTKLICRQDKAKFVVPNYPTGFNLQLPGAQDEKNMLIELCNAKPIVPNKMDVIKAMLEPRKFDILHFSCHGEADPASIWDAGLLMEGNVQNNKYKKDILLSTEVELSAQLHDGSLPGPLIFLNACQIGREGYNLTGTGGFAKAFMSKGAGAFIGTHWSIGDYTALEFSKTFYQKMLDGENIMNAVTSAREASKNNNEVSWLAYVVYADPYATLEFEG